jgi:hypothetical protein
MTDVFTLSFEQIQPSQLYISRAKLHRVMKYLKSGSLALMEPIPVKELDGEIVSTDGHTRGLAYFLRGQKEVEAVWEDTDLDWEEYAICVDWCKKEGIRRIPDLRSRVISHAQYEVLWLDRCERMHEKLAAERARKQTCPPTSGPHEQQD